MQLDLQVRLDRALLRLNKLPDAVRAALKVEATALATKLQAKAKDKFSEFFQERSGRYLKSIKKSVRVNKKGVVGKVYSKGDPVAHFLEKGTKPHIIEPKNAAVLFYLGQAFKVVHHPGMQGHSIINAAFQEMKPEIRDGLASAVQSGLVEGAPVT